MNTYLVKWYIICILLFAGKLHAQPWSFVKTDANHSILIPANFAVNSDTGAVASPLYIGAFYDSAGIKKCAGAIKWEGKATTLVIYGAVDALYEKRPGFEQNDTIFFVIATDKCVFSTATPTFQEPDGIFILSKERFKRNGISRLTAINASLGNASYAQERFCLAEITEFPLAITNISDLSITGSSGLSLSANGTINMSQSENGAHEVYLQSAFCIQQDTLEVYLDKSFIDLPSSLSSCDSILLNIDASFSNIIWNTGEQTPSIFATESGSYEVMAVSITGCELRDTTAVEIFPKPNFSLGEDITSCSPITLVADGYEVVQWNNNSTDDSLIVTYPGGEIAAIVSNSDGCIASDTINVEITSDFNINLPDSIESCEGEVLLMPEILGNYGELAFNWSNGSTEETNRVVTSGNYVVSVENMEDGCIVVVSSDVMIGHEPIWGNITDSTLAITCHQEGTIQLNVQAPQLDNYLWKLDSEEEWTNSTIFTNLEEGGFQITAQGSTGCEYLYPNITSVIDSTYQCEGVVLTPNGDGHEDFYRVDCVGAIIYNRFGHEVTRLNQKTLWDGRGKDGQLVAIGYYVVICKDGLTSSVTVIY